MENIYALKLGIVQGVEFLRNKHFKKAYLNSDMLFDVSLKICILVNDVKQNDVKIKFNYKLNIKLNI